VKPPDITYRLARPPASSGPLIELFTAHLGASGTSAGLQVLIPGIAMDRVLVLTNVAVVAAPGLTQAPLRIVVEGRTPSGVQFGITRQSVAAVADLRHDLNWSGEVMIGGGGTDTNIIICDTTFDAGVASNSMVISAFGYVIPRGNIAPF